jgi:hypothetical protein
MRAFPTLATVLLSVTISLLIVWSFPADERIAKLTQQFLVQNSIDALIDACNQDAETEGFSERFSRKDLKTAYFRSANLRPPEQASVIAIKHEGLACSWRGYGRADVGVMTGDYDY